MSLRKPAIKDRHSSTPGFSPISVFNIKPLLTNVYNFAKILLAILDTSISIVVSLGLGLLFSRGSLIYTSYRASVTYITIYINSELLIYDIETTDIKSKMWQNTIMSDVLITLKQYIREKEAEWQKDITWANIREATGVSESTLNRLINGKAQRVDRGVLAKLCHFFNVPPGPIPFIVYEPSPASDETEEQ